MTRIRVKSSEHNGPYIAAPIYTNRLIFNKLILSEYANQSHHFTNFSFCDVTLLYLELEPKCDPQLFLGSLPVAGPDLQISGGGGEGHFGLKIRGRAPRAPPLDPLLVTGQVTVSEEKFNLAQFLSRF